MPFVGIGVGVGRQRFSQGGGIFAAYAARVAADGGVTEAGACVNAVSGISLNSSLLLVPSGYKSGVVYSEIPTDGDGDLTFTRASSATRVNSDGEIEVVGSGVPRLDYSQGSCPALLLEPQRTNLVLYSEQFDNAGWEFYFGTQVANTTETLDPSGYYGAEKVIMGSGNQAVYRQSIGGLTNGATYTLSLYIKQGSGVTAFLDISDTSSTVNITPTGEWVRYTKTGVWNTSANYIDLEFRGTSGSAYCYLWGAQLEAGSYATSYIPTSGATVTRLGDACFKTGISSLIGQTEGTLFAEVEILNNAVGWILDASDGTTTNRTLFFKLTNNQIRFLRISTTQSSSTAVDSSILSLGVHKIALAYQSGNTAFFIDGVQISTTNTATFTNGTLNKISLGTAGDGSGNQLGDRISQAIIFPTRLSNTQLAELTTL